MTFTKTDPEDLDSPRRELSNGSLKSVVALLVCRQIDFLCVQLIGNPLFNVFCMVSHMYFTCITHLDYIYLHFTCIICISNYIII